MKKLFRYMLITLQLFFVASCYNEVLVDPTNVGSTVVVTFDNNRVFFDNEKHIALTSVNDYGSFGPVIRFRDIDGLLLNGNTVHNNSEFALGEINKHSEHTITLVIGKNDSLTYQLKYTLLPTISIEYFEDKIVDEPKISAKFSMTDPMVKGTRVEFCGIELRGGSAKSWPKLSYGFEFYDDFAGTDDKSIALLNLPENDDWIFDGIYSDKSCSRNRVSFELWKQIQNNSIQEGNDVLYSAIDGEFVEVFMNQQYQGVYVMSQKVDAVTLGFDEHHPKGFIYKCENWNPVSKFQEITDTIDQELAWAGWEQKYPRGDEKAIWQPLYRLTDFVVNATDEQFAQNYSSYIVMDQFIDFVILVNMIKGYDNVGQNLILATKSIDEPFYFCPWDMDAAWGRDWDSTLKDANGYVYWRIYERFVAANPDDFNMRLSKRWSNLRTNVITYNNLCDLFGKRFSLLENSGAAEREQHLWDDSYPDPDWEKEYIEGWIGDRLQVLDDYFNKLASL